MSAHNHDEEIQKRFGTKMAHRLQKKADDAFDEKIRNAIMKTDISGLSREAAKDKLHKVVECIFDEEE